MGFNVLPGDSGELQGTPVQRLVRKASGGSAASSRGSVSSLADQQNNSYTDEDQVQGVNKPEYNTINSQHWTGERTNYDRLESKHLKLFWYDILFKTKRVIS